VICVVAKTFFVTKIHIYLLLARCRTLCSSEHGRIGTNFTRSENLYTLPAWTSLWCKNLTATHQGLGTDQTIELQGGLGRPFEPEIHSSMAQQQQQQMGMATQRSASRAADFLPYCNRSHPILPTIHSFPSLDGIALTLLYQPHCNPMLSCLSFALCASCCVSCSDSTMVKRFSAAAPSFNAQSNDSVLNTEQK